MPNFKFAQTSVDNLSLYFPSFQFPHLNSGPLRLLPKAYEKSEKTTAFLRFPLKHINVSKPADFGSLQRSCELCMAANPCSPARPEQAAGEHRGFATAAQSSCLLLAQPQSTIPCAFQSPLFPGSYSLLGTHFASEPLEVPAVGSGWSYAGSEGDTD